MRKPMSIMITLIVIVFGGIFGVKYYLQLAQQSFRKHFVPPPMVVSASVSQAEQWQPKLFAVGSLKAVQGIELTAEVPGVIKSLHFHSGDTVKKGQRLIQLDDQSEKAQLQGLIAQRKLDQINFQRDQKLLRKKVISQNTLDSSSTVLKKSIANVAEARAAVAQKVIRAPFSGNIGVSQVDLGQYISPGYQMVPLQDIDTLKVDFYLPEQDFPKLYQGQKIQINVDAYPEKVFTGSIRAINATVDPETRKILVRAQLKNKNKQLMPGMFANIEVMLRDVVSVVSVPVTAIDYSLYGKTVYVLEATDETTKDKKTIYTAHSVYVKTGLEQSNHIAITEGLKANQTIIDAGQLKLADDMRVILTSPDVTKAE